TGAYVGDSSSSGIDPGSNSITLSEDEPQIPDGMIVQYHAGGAGNEISGLQDGTYYQAVVSASDPTTVHFQLLGGQTVQLNTVETFTDANGHTYTLMGANAYTETVSVQEVGNPSSPDLSEGQALTYHGAFNSFTGGLQDGQQYYVHLLNATDPANGAALIQ